jgi:hypothetical protein
MDTDSQLYEVEVTGWRRGLYEDVQATFRAPIVNWIFRTLVANVPELTRYLWGQIGPVFETRAFGRFTLDWRDRVLSAVEDGDGAASARPDAPGLPAVRRSDADLSPAEFAELRGQLATFDVVVPRLAVLFETVDRALRDEEDGTPVGGSPATDRTATAPLPEWVDRDRGRPPTMAPVEAVADDCPAVVDAVQSFHGFDEGLPSVYRCLGQWPGAFEYLWSGLDSTLESDAFDRAVEESRGLVADHVSALPYRPRLSSDDLRGAGFDEGTVANVRELFETFNRGPVATVLPAVSLFAAAVDVAGERSGL